jgi:small subunit ribosomal protein S20
MALAIHIIASRARVDSGWRLGENGGSQIWSRDSYSDFRRNHLANSPQALKRARQAEQHRQHNASRRSAMRTYIKNTLKAIAAGDKEGAMAAFNIAVPFIDRAAGKGLIHANKAARHKSRINARIKAMA